ncbi:threonine aldolase family protein [Chelativorans salis]|uniref:L-threonine aldolase n=1 Tax=Chelativorans salis TaxID=2978478 RepID=A0ABT2LWD7_9HYPH|nr:low specificity L-threonine aldolase [Chelativorans sp. EGI FJ00035]MCT7377509.1 low specificity L-threonine aldolase [Chelativorans sp. EGI FJ00035]
MNFASDNWAGAHPAITQALAEHSGGFATAYGLSDIDRRVEERFCEIFEREVAVFFVATGTAANSLSMALANRPGGVIFCHAHAHMLEDEGGAPEYLTGGARTHGVDGALGRVGTEALEKAIRQFPAEFVHMGQPMAVSITQATEIGTVYSLDQIAAISETCRAHGLPLHMDGARFANALAALDTTPAEMTWKRGVDVVSFGATKNGCWCAEAIVVMDPGQARDMPFLRKRAAHLFSKSRFIAAQFDAYFRDDLWLKNARHANAMAARLAGHVEKSARLRLAWRPDANEVFTVMETATAEELKAGGVAFHDWPAPYASLLGEGEMLLRFVTSFATTEEEVDRFGQIVA